MSNDFIMMHLCKVSKKNHGEIADDVAIDDLEHEDSVERKSMSGREGDKNESVLKNDKARSSTTITSARSN